MPRRAAAKKVVDAATTPAVVEVTPARQVGAQGGYEGAAQFSRELFSWQPQVISADAQMRHAKEPADARARDSVQNDGYAAGALNTYRDSIVGGHYRLNARPVWKLIPGATEEWAEEMQHIVESEFNLLGDSEQCWFDASRTQTFTGLIRLGIASWGLHGEVLGTVEWVREAARPFRTAVQMISPHRLSNPDGETNTKLLRNGIVKNVFGKPTGYWIRMAHPGESMLTDEAFKWRLVDAEKPWGRKQVIHIYEPLQADQSRGLSEFVSVLKQMRMTKKYQDVTLQNAAIQASYAAAIESELPREVLMQAMGAGASGDPTQGIGGYIGSYLQMLSQYLSNADNVKIDGAKIPIFFPGTKLNLQPMGTPGGVGTEFETSLLRHTAAALNLSYEEFARDYTKTNYSSARAGMLTTQRAMGARKKAIADRQASTIYTLWFEERWNAGRIPIPRGQSPDIFYDPVIREALTNCTWIGASRGQIDELKETQSAVWRIAGGLSTFEDECARLGLDWREVFAQRARENRLLKELDLTINLGAQKPQPGGEVGAESDDGDEAAQETARDREDARETRKALRDLISRS